VEITTSTVYGWIETRVSDNGIGIPPERMEKIFETFEQGGAEIQDEFGGLGLGLAICRALVEAHGGRISAQSAGSGRGATFMVKMPIEADGQLGGTRATG
jgi:signal transduction histidine kinase